MDHESANPAADLEKARQLAVQDDQVDLLDDVEDGEPLDASAVVYVSTEPAELLQIDGPAQSHRRGCSTSPIRPTDFSRSRDRQPLRAHFRTLVSGAALQDGPSERGRRQAAGDFARIARPCNRTYPQAP